MILPYRLQNLAKIIHGVEVKILDTFEEEGWITIWAGHEVSCWSAGNNLFLDKAVFTEIFTL